MLIFGCADRVLPSKYGLPIHSGRSSIHRRNAEKRMHSPWPLCAPCVSAVNIYRQHPA